MEKIHKRLNLFLVINLFIMYIVSFTLLLYPTTTVNADSTDNLEDTQVGKGNKSVEAAVAAGKTLLGKVPYVIGDMSKNGHGGSWDYFDTYKPGGVYGLDCSAFIGWIWSKGAGVGLGPNIPNTWALRDGAGFQKYKVKISSWADVKRGDILNMNNCSHVVMALGDNKYIGSDGSGDYSAGGGPTIKEFNNGWMSTDGYAIRLPDADTLIKENPGFFIKTTTLDGLDIGSSTGGDEEDSSLLGKLKSKLPEPKVVLVAREYGIQDVGINDSQGGISGTTVLFANKYVNKLLEAIKIVAVGASFIFFGYMAVVLIIYVTVMPRTGSFKFMAWFEKLTKVDPIPNRDGVLNLLGRMMGSILIMAIFYSNAHVYMMSTVIRLFSTIF